MALTTEEQTYLTNLYAARTKILSGSWVEGTEVGGKSRSFASPPSLPFINKEISRLENKSSVITGGRRVSTTVKSDTW